FNFRMTNLQAALGLAQLERLDEFVERKRKMGLLYTGLLRDVGNFQLPVRQTSFAQNIYWVFGIVSNDIALDAITCMKSLAAVGVGTRPFFYPMHKQPVFAKMGLFSNESYPVAEKISEQGFYIPSGMALTES